VKSATRLPYLRGLVQVTFVVIRAVRSAVREVLSVYSVHTASNRSTWDLIVRPTNLMGMVNALNWVAAASCARACS
jgi:hypothetical protein